MDELLADLPAINTISFPSLNLFSVPSPIYVCIAVIPLLVITNEVLMTLLTTLALHFPRTVLTLFVFLLWSTAVVLITMAQGLHEYTISINSSLSELLLKWMFIAGACAVVLFPFFIMPPHRKPANQRKQLATYQEQDFRLRSLGYNLFYYLITSLNIVLSVSLVLMYFKHENEQVLSAKSWLMGLSVGWSYWTITGFFLHVIRINTIKPRPSLSLLSSVTENDNESDRGSLVDKETAGSLDRYLAECFYFKVRSEQCKHGKLYYCGSCRKIKISETKVYHVIYFIALAVFMLGGTVATIYYMVMDVRAFQWGTFLGFVLTTIILSFIYFVLFKLISSHMREIVYKEEVRNSSETTYSKSIAMSPMNNSSLSLRESRTNLGGMASTDALAPRARDTPKENNSPKRPLTMAVPASASASSSKEPTKRPLTMMPPAKDNQSKQESNDQIRQESSQKEIKQGSTLQKSSKLDEPAHKASAAKITAVSPITTKPATSTPVIIPRGESRENWGPSAQVSPILANLPSNTEASTVSNESQPPTRSVTVIIPMSPGADDSTKHIINHEQFDKKPPVMVVTPATPMKENSSSGTIKRPITFMLPSNSTKEESGTPPNKRPLTMMTPLNTEQTQSPTTQKKFAGAVATPLTKIKPIFAPIESEFDDIENALKKAMTDTGILASPPPSTYTTSASTQLGRQENHPTSASTYTTPAATQVAKRDPKDVSAMLSTPTTTQVPKQDPRDVSSTSTQLSMGKNILTPSTIESFLPWLESPQCLNTTKPLFEARDPSKQILVPEFLAEFQVLLKESGKAFFWHLLKLIKDDGEIMLCPDHFDRAKSQYYGFESAQRDFIDGFKKKMNLSKIEEWDPQFKTVEDVQKLVRVLITLKEQVETTKKVTLLTEADYTLTKWKNGLGTTEEIWIDPPGSDFRTSFKWRLSRAHIASSCSFSHFPNCTNTIVILPPSHSADTSPMLLGTSDEDTARKNGDNLVVKMTHNDSTPHLIRPLVPYTYSGAWQTICGLTRECKDITVMVNNHDAIAEVSVETIDNEASFRHLMFSSACAVYAVSGHVRISIDTQTVILGKGQSLVIEKSDECAPRWLVVSAESDVEVPTVSGSFLIPNSPPLVRPETVLKATLPKARTQTNLDLQSTFIFVQIKYLSAHEDTELSRKGSIVLNEIGSDLGQPRYPLAEPAFIYSPPPWSLRPPQESLLPPPLNLDELDWESVKPGTICAAWVKMLKHGLSDWIKIPVVIARGANSKPNSEAIFKGGKDTVMAKHASSLKKEVVFGITAALHGNEVNGVSCLQRLIADLDVTKINGTVVGVYCINTPGYLNFKREFSDGRDLNRQFPGKKDGVASQIYAHLVMEKIVKHFDYMIDLHTASFGRVNSYYVRADMNDPVSAAMARLQQPQIILHNSGQDGTMRSAASARGTKSITVEIGNPQQFQSQFIQWTTRGLRNILHELGLYDENIPSTPSIQRSLEQLDLTQQFDVYQDIQPYPAVLCGKGFWMYTKTGGVLEVYPSVNMLVKKGMLVARILNIYGNTVEEYEAPCDAMVIGKSSNPVAMAGDRIIHFGVPMRVGDMLPAVAKENY